MARIASVVNGEVVITNEYGGKLTHFRPSSGGTPIFVDTHPTTEQLVVTTDRGSVVICGPTGGWIKGFDSSSSNKIVLARWMGDNLFIQHADGSKVLRNSSGGFVRYL